MAHVQPGDIIFFKPAGILSRLNVLGQSILTRRPARWSHVAICVDGPLVMHATPRHKDLPSLRRVWLALTGAPSAGSGLNPGAHEGGAHLELLGHEYVKGASFTVMRLRSAATEAGFADGLREATTYWLAQQYSFLSIYLTHLAGRAAFLPGQSFCSFLVQQVCARMGLNRFGILETTAARTLMPGELFDLLSTDQQHWQRLESASLAGTDPEERLNDAIRQNLAAPLPALTDHLARYKATMVVMLLDGRARILQIGKVQLLNQLFAEMNKVRDQVASAVALLPPADAQTIINHAQSEIGPLLDRVSAEVGADSAPANDLLFMNYQRLVSIVLAQKSSQAVKLANHWTAAWGGASLPGPDEDFVDRYIASQNAIVAAIGLRRIGALPPSPEPRWQLPPDLPATLALIQNDIRRLDGCRLPDWHVQRAKLREVLVRMQEIVTASAASVETH